MYDKMIKLNMYEGNSFSSHYFKKMLIFLVSYGDKVLYKF